MSEYDALALADEVRERGSLPASDVRFTNAKILTAATKELREGIAPLLAETRAEHMVYPYKTAVVPGQANYRMPLRSVGGSLRDVYYLDDTGQPKYPPLRQLSGDDMLAYRVDQATPDSYYVRNYEVILTPPPNIGGTLLLPYYARPNALVLPTQAIAVVEVNENDTTVTLTLEYDDPAALVPFPYNTPFLDVVRAAPGFETLLASASNFSPVNLGGGTVNLTFNKSELISQVPEDGDWVCLPGQSPVPQCPVETHGLLAVRTARRLLKAVGDPEWQGLDADVQELELHVRSVLTPRVASHTQQAGNSIGANGMVAGVYGRWW